LICRSGWGFLLILACAYFAYASYATIRDSDLVWRHQFWQVATWAVWTLLAAGLINETHCWRERLLFLILLFTFAIGLAFSLWESAPFSTIRTARFASLVLWILATVTALFATFAPLRHTSSTETQNSH